MQKRKGAMQGIIMAVIVTFMLLFVGVFMIDKVSSVTPQTSLYNYSYTAVTNSTKATSDGNINATNILTQVIVTGAFQNPNITDDTPLSTLAVSVENRGATSGNANATLNGVSLGTFSIPAAANTTYTFANAGFKESTNNNLTFGAVYGASTNGVNVSMNTSVSTYASGRSNTWSGTIFTKLNTNTGTVFDVLILVVIVSALGVAIFAIKSFAGGSESVSSGSAF